GAPPASLTSSPGGAASVDMPALSWALIALVYHLTSRLAYVLYIGLALRRQERTGFLTERYGPNGGFRRFRQTAAILMYNDATSFVLLCLASWGTLHLGLGAARLDHVAILAFYWLVEKPHFERVRERR